jgi:hypothetical protein
VLEQASCKERAMPPNRIVALFTPIIAVAAGGVATWLADNVGLNVDQGELQAVFVAGLLAVLAPAAQWLHGNQRWERYQQDLDQAALQADTEAAARAGDAGEEPYEDDEYDDYEDDGYDDDEDGVDEDYEAARDEPGEPATVGA